MPGTSSEPSMVRPEPRVKFPGVITRTLPLTRPLPSCGVFFETTASVTAAWEISWKASKQNNQAVFPKRAGREEKIGVRVENFILGTPEGKVCSSVYLADSRSKIAMNPQNPSIFVG